MTVEVVAIQTPKPGRLDAILAAFSRVSPLVHEEAGCEFYAAHTDGDVVVMIERWSTRADLDAHASGEPLRLLLELIGDDLERPYDVWILENVPLGLATKGTIPGR